MKKVSRKLNEFLVDFPSVTRSQAIALLEIAEKLVTSKFGRAVN
jgi:hypothetical protein